MPSATHKKSIVYITRSAPYGGNRAQLCLDMVLASAVFEQDITYLFLGDGVYQLLPQQNSQGIDAKPLVNALETLELYGVEKIFVDKQSIDTRNIREQDLALKTTLVGRADIANLLDQADAVFTL